MKLSAFFNELSSSYAYEIEDLTWDSGGDNVLAKRLKVKRDQFDQLLPMSEFDPVMVAPAFRGGFRFAAKELSQDIFGRLLSAQPGGFPTWDALSETIEMEPWAERLAERALRAPGGERFMLIAAALEYVFSGNVAATPAIDTEAADSDRDKEEGRDADSDDAPQGDLAEAGEDYLSEQGFDRRS